MSGFEYAAAGPVRRGIRNLVTARPVAWASARILPALDVFALRVSSGRRTLSGWLTGLPVVSLETTGARSGVLRRAQVMAVPDGEALLVAAANFGSARQPAWYHNAIAHPEVTVCRADVRQAMRARELHGLEREAAFDRALALNPGWRRFRARAGERVIPVLRLAPPGM